MKPSGYIGSGVGSALLGVVLIVIARADDDLNAAMARAEMVLGETPTPDSDALWYLAALALFAVAAVLILIGAIGLGVRVGQRSGD